MLSIKKVLTHSTKQIFPICFLIVTFSLFSVFGQAKIDADVRPLTIEKSVERELKGDEAHSYILSLQVGQFLNVVVEQKGVDVVVRLFDSDNKKLVEVDSPNGMQGVESLYVIIETTGNYRLEVRPLDKKVATGNYEVKIKELRAGTEKDKNLIKAHNTFNEGVTLQAQRTAESFNSAIKKYQESISFYRIAENRLGEAEALSKIGGIYLAFGENRKAIEFYNQALTLFKSVKDSSGQATTLGNIGSAYGELGENQKAIDYYNQVLPFFKAVGNKNSEMIVLINIGASYSTLGEHQKALEFYNQALKLSREVKNKYLEGTLLNNIASLYSQLGSYQKALDYYNQILSIIDKEQIGPSILNNIGFNYSTLRNYQKALEFYNQALLLSKANNIKGVEATTLGNIGLIYYNLGENQKALDYYNQALGLSRVLGVKSLESGMLNNIGLIYYRLGEDQKTLEYLYQALLIEKATNDRARETNTLGWLRNYWSDHKNAGLAIFYGKQSINKYQELRLAIKGLDKETQQTYLTTIEKNYQKLADLLIAQGRFAEAQQVLSLLKGEEYFEYIRRDANEIKNLKERITLKPDEQKLIERYNLLADKVTAIGTEFQKLDDKKRKLAVGTSLPTEEQKLYDTLSAQLNDTNAAFKLFLEKELIAELGKSVKKEIEIDRALQNKLRNWGDGIVALFTIAGEDRYRVILTTPTVQVDGKTEIKSADLNKKIFAFREALQNPAIDPRPLGKELYDILIKPIEKDLIAANAKTLLWSLDGTLRYIPISALSTHSKSYLLKKYQNVVITSTTRQSLMSETEKD